MSVRESGGECVCESVCGMERESVWVREFVSCSVSVRESERWRRHTERQRTGKTRKKSVMERNKFA